MLRDLTRYWWTFTLRGVIAVLFGIVLLVLGTRLRGLSKKLREATA